MTRTTRSGTAGELRARGKACRRRPDQPVAAFIPAVAVTLASSGPLGEMADAGVTNAGEGERWLQARRDACITAWTAQNGA